MFHTPPERGCFQLSFNALNVEIQSQVPKLFGIEFAIVFFNQTLIKRHFRPKVLPNPHRFLVLNGNCFELQKILASDEFRWALAHSTHVFISFQRKSFRFDFLTVKPASILKTSPYSANAVCSVLDQCCIPICMAAASILRCWVQSLLLVYRLLPKCNFRAYQRTTKKCATIMRWVRVTSRVGQDFWPVV